MGTFTPIELVWELRRAGVGVPLIAQRAGKHRATIYRWLKGIRLAGLREFEREYREAKKRPPEARWRVMGPSGSSPSGGSITMAVGRRSCGGWGRRGSP